MKTYRLGSILAGGNDGGHRKSKPFILTDDDLDTHLAVFGVTGAGKSRFLWQLVREHFRNGRGFCLIDCGDLTSDCLADVARRMMDTGDQSLLKKIHVIELSPFQLTRYDPFRFHFPKNVHPELRETLYRSWQHTMVQSHAEIYQWKQGQSTDFEGMPRLQRMFINVFTAASTLVRARRLSAGDAHLLVDVSHPRHLAVFNRLRPRLPREIVADFETLHNMRTVRDYRQETESFINRIRTTHGPLFKEMLTCGPNDPVFELNQAMQHGDFVFVKVARSPFVSNDQNNALASTFIHDVFDTALITPREMRRPFTLFIDEGHKYARKGLGELARTARKYHLSLVFATPDLVSLRTKDFDLAAELLDVVNTVVSFRMTWPEDVTKMAEFLYAQNIDFTELEHEVERRAGPQWIPVDEYSESYQKQNGKGVTSATTVTESAQQQESAAHSLQNGRSLATDANGRPRGVTRNTGEADTKGTSHATGRSTAAQNGVSQTESESFGITVNHKLVHIEKIVRERQRTGMLATAVNDQVAKFAQQISGHSRKRGSARVREGKGFEFQSTNVADPFFSAEAQTRAVDWIMRELYRTHDYFFTPTLDPEDEMRRLNEFLSIDEPPVCGAPINREDPRAHEGDERNPLA